MNRYENFYSIAVIDRKIKNLQRFNFFGIFNYSITLLLNHRFELERSIYFLLSNTHAINCTCLACSFQRSFSSE